MAQLADDGDRAAILAMLAALDPARYGPPGRTKAPDVITGDADNPVRAAIEVRFIKPGE